MFSTHCASLKNLPKFVPIKDKEKMHKSTVSFSNGKFDMSYISTKSLDFARSKDQIYLNKIKLLFLSMKCYCTFASPQPRSRATLFILLLIK